MLEKNKTYSILFFVFILSFLAFNFIWPEFLNFPYFPKREFNLGLDLQGGTHLVYQADLSQITENEKSQVMEGLKDVIERRINIFGVKEPIIQVQGERLIVELAGTVDPDEAIREIGKTPFLEFREEKENFAEIWEKFKKGEKTEEPFKPTELTGRYLQRAYFSFSSLTNEPVVVLEFNDEGRKILEKLTEKNIGKILAIYLDGVPISTPVVQEIISGGKGQIIGNFTVEQAKELARNLNAGALPAPIYLISQQTIGPMLGKKSLEDSLKAGLLGFLWIFLFLIIFYRFPGILAAISLVIYIIFVLALFKLIPVTLTLAGIAGFLLSVGMAVDANILIFSRMREKLKEGKDFLNSIEEGVKMSWPAIRDGNLTTILVGLILFSFGTSFVKGFAFTLIIGNLINIFTGVFITKYLLKALAFTKLAKIRIIW